MFGRRGWLLLPVLLAACAGAGCKKQDQNVRVLLLTAVDNEYEAVKTLIPNGREQMIEGRQTTVGVVNGSRIAVMRSGWGKAQSAAATAIGIQRFSPAIVIFAGVGAGLDPSRATSGDVVIVEGSFQYDLGQRTGTGFEIWPPETPMEKPYPSGNFGSSTLANAALAAAKKVPLQAWEIKTQCMCSNEGVPASGCTAPVVQIGRAAPRVCKGIAATADTFLADPAVAQMLAKTKNASVVDMETAAVAEEAMNSGLPFIAVRVVADLPDGSNENLYFCLKPLSGERLHAIIGSILERLTTSSTNAAPDADGEQCLTPDLPSADPGSSNR
jgi:adenosylhomocysteine nucleosidase